MRQGRPSTQDQHGWKPGLQIICLASGGGPSEENVTGFLVRSLATKWAKNSVLAVDAGTHMAAITNILEADFPRVVLESAASRSNDDSHHQSNQESSSGYSTESREPSPEPESIHLHNGPFAGARFPFRTARANSLYFVRECVSTYLITHPHLDHISALAINTAAFHNTSRPKRLAALPTTISAIKTHIFNDVIWPNLTDEDGGVGFLTFQRLAQGGNIAVGEGTGKGYIEVCDGLCVKGMKISHGCCTRILSPTSPRHSDVGLSEVMRASQPSETVSINDRRTPSFTQTIASNPGTPSMMMNISGFLPAAGSNTASREVVIDSTAYFIRDDYTKREVLMFGDVEPDSLSLSPRTLSVWQEAAPKIASGALKAIVIECSFDDSQDDTMLFGHMAPRHLVEELAVLADLVLQFKLRHHGRRSNKRRKRQRSDDSQSGLYSSNNDVSHHLEYPSDSHHHLGPAGQDDVETSISTISALPFPTSNTEPSQKQPQWTEQRSDENNETATVALPKAVPDVPALVGVKIMIMHMKDTMRDGPHIGETILRQLLEHEATLRSVNGRGLGCEFVICAAGSSHYV